MTFGDVFGSDERAATPILCAAGVSATAFVASAFVGSREPFPFGRTAVGFAGGRLTEAAVGLGVSATFTTDGGPLPPGTPPVDWPRTTVHDDDTAATLDARLSGRFASSGARRRASSQPWPSSRPC